MGIFNKLFGNQGSKLNLQKTSEILDEDRFWEIVVGTLVING